MGSLTQKIYCAFCRLERRVYVKKSISWTNVVLSFFAASLLMFSIWQRLEARMVIFFVIFLAVSEVFVRLRWRMSMPCPHCGFDPVLYKTDREETVRKVTEHLAQLKKSGSYLLKSQSPFENLPSRKAQPENTKINNLARPERRLSKQV
jgi:hypothetical protein